MNVTNEDVDILLQIPVVYCCSHVIIESPTVARLVSSFVSFGIDLLYLSVKTVTIL